MNGRVGGRHYSSTREAALGSYFQAILKIFFVLISRVTEVHSHIKPPWRNELTHCINNLYILAGNSDCSMNPFDDAFFKKNIPFLLVVRRIGINDLYVFNQ